MADVVLLSAPPERGEDVQVRVSAPETGRDLPIIVFSHGFISSMNGYDPLVDYWASHGFVVIQPTHLDSRTLNLPPEDPRTPLIWRHRIDDLTLILDRLDVIEASVPGLAGRLDRTRIAAAGHSWGGQTVSMLLGTRVLDADGRPGEDMTDPRIKAGVLLATAGTGGEDLTPFAAENFPFMHPDFSRMTTPALVVAGDRDQSFLSKRGPDWFTDAYFLSPGTDGGEGDDSGEDGDIGDDSGDGGDGGEGAGGAGVASGSRAGKSLLTLFGAEHSLGGITGYDDPETTDENPARVALLRELTCAYLRSALYPEDPQWSEARATLEARPDPLGRIESR